MRDYLYSDSSNKKANTSIVKTLVAIILSLIIFFGMLLIFSFVIVKTNFNEKYESLVVIFATAILSIFLSSIITIKVNLKPIYCSLISLGFVFVLKLTLNLVFSTEIVFGKQGITGLIFSFIFSICGAILGSNIKK